MTRKELVKFVGTISIAVSLSLLPACHGSDDDDVADPASSFTGSWIGDGSLTPSSVVSPDSGQRFMFEGVTLASSGPNVLELANVCFGSDRVPAQVTSDTSFVISPYTCVPVPTPDVWDNYSFGCAQPTTMSVQGGSGSLSDGSLEIAATGTLRTCGNDYTFVYSFSGQRP